jgi:DNA-binding NtrC family response regulator
MADRRTILLVDDDDDFLLQYRVSLENAGYRVVTAGGRNEAEKVVETETIDCAVIDLMMEETDGGFILAHHLKNRKPAMPIIMVTGVTYETGLHFGAVNVTEKKWLKADTVLAKPIRFEQLDREIKRLLA